MWIIIIIMVLPNNRHKSVTIKSVFVVLQVLVRAEEMSGNVV